MVLSKQFYTARDSHNGACVSIPLWFFPNIITPIIRYLPDSSFHPTMVLSKPVEFEIESCKLQFPSHYGSFQTTWPDNMWYYLINVSIPLWFFPNTLTFGDVKILVTSFHPTMVLSKLPIDWEMSVIIYVSIPLWFFPNTTCYTQRSCRITQFPSHYGSFQTRRYMLGYRV